jgi:hypothetical protein
MFDVQGNLLKLLPGGRHNRWVIVANTQCGPAICKINENVSPRRDPHSMTNRPFLSTNVNRREGLADDTNENFSFGFFLWEMKRLQYLYRSCF